MKRQPTKTKRPGSLQGRVRPRFVYLSRATDCCAAQVLVDCAGVFKCPCGKDRENQAQIVIARAPNQCAWPNSEVTDPNGLGIRAAKGSAIP